MLNLLQGNTYEMHKKNKIMALQYVNVGSMGCFSATFITICITFDFRHALLRKDKDFAGLKWLTDVIPDFCSHSEFQLYKVKKSYNRYGEERFMNIMYIKMNLLILWTVQIFQFLG